MLVGIEKDRPSNAHIKELLRLVPTSSVSLRQEAKRLRGAPSSVLCKLSSSLASNDHSTWAQLELFT